MALRALVVDDSMLVRHTVCRFLEQRGYEVDSATNGVEALEKLTHALPDIVITDMVMPQMTGSQLIDSLKARPETASIPIVVLSGRPSGSDAQDEKRANFVIHKDIDIEQQLEKALAGALGNAYPSQKQAVGNQAPTSGLPSRA
ncbi:MAG TPA: response regulator [Terriglobales bacterium]|nr:response regulator [Terriglobales bacterium]